MLQLNPSREDDVDIKLVSLVTCSGVLKGLSVHLWLHIDALVTLTTSW